MTLDTLHNLIEYFSIDLLQQFFRENIRTFRTDEENYEYLFDGNEDINKKYTDISKIGEADISNSDDLLVITAKTFAPLTNKTGKKQQFDLKYYLFLIQNLVKDLLVYDLYGLTEEGVQIVDPDFTLTKESYDDFKNVL